MSDSRDLLAQQIRAALGEFNNDNEAVVTLVSTLNARLAEAEILLDAWHDAYHADAGMEGLDDDTTTWLAGISIGAVKVPGMEPQGSTQYVKVQGVSDGIIYDMEVAADSAPEGRCPRCSFDPTSLSDYCDEHRPASTAPAAPLCPYCGMPDCGYTGGECVAETVPAALCQFCGADINAGPHRNWCPVISSTADAGHSVQCSECGATHVLRYTDRAKTAVSLAGFDGWSVDSSGVRCPKCSTASTVDAAREGS